MFSSRPNIKAHEPAHLLAPVAITSFSVVEAAAEVYPLIEELVLPDAVGIYKSEGSIEPLVTPNMELRLGNGTPVRYEQLHLINENVYNVYGRLVLPQTLLVNKRHKLRLTPAISKIAITILKSYLDFRVASLTQWASHGHALASFNRLFHSDLSNATVNEAENIISRNIKDLESEVMSLVSEDPWAMYDTFLLGEGLYVVARLGDWRAYQWAIRTHDEQNPDLYV